MWDQIGPLAVMEAGGTQECKQYSGDGKVCWQSGLKKRQSHTALQTSHERFIGREEPRRVAPSTWAEAAEN